LYEERHALLAQRRLDELTAPGVIFLRDIEREIDRWEAEPEQGPSQEVWSQLEKLACDLLAARGKVGSKR